MYILELAPFARKVQCTLKRFLCAQEAHSRLRIPNQIWEILSLFEAGGNGSEMNRSTLWRWELCLAKTHPVQKCCYLLYSLWFRCEKNRISQCISMCMLASGVWVLLWTVRFGSLRFASFCSVNGTLLKALKLYFDPSLSRKFMSR